ncbi:hypothetical protein ACS0TY_026175 [Phlomoides rotata]
MVGRDDTQVAHPVGGEVSTLRLFASMGEFPLSRTWNWLRIRGNINTHYNTNAYMIVIINGIGCVIETIYIFIFVIYAPKKARIRTMSLIFLFNVGGLGVIMLVSLLCVKAGSHRVALVGWICVAFNLAVFVAPFSIMRQVVRTKSVEFMPFTLSLFLTLCATMWFFYGFFIKDYYIAVLIDDIIMYTWSALNAKKDDTSKLELDPSKNIEKNLDPEEANHIGNVSK